MQMLPNLMSILILTSPFVIFGLGGLFWKNSPLKGSTLWILTLSVVVTYGLYVGHAIAAQKAADVKLQSFDLNHDGTISNNEETPAYYDTLTRWSQDTGRSLALYFVWFVAITLNSVALVFYWPAVSIVKAVWSRMARECRS